MALQSEILGDLDGARSIGPEWDRLAVESGRPYGAPAWALAWWRHAAPAGAALRVIAVREREELVGVAPLWATRGAAARSAYEFLGGRVCAPTGPLARAGREAEVAETLTAALADAEPRPSELAIEASVADGWSERLRERWPGREAWKLVRLSRPLPTILFEGLDYEAWLGGKSAKFRQRARRVRRRLEEQGGSFREAGPAEFAEDLTTFERLHAGRWEGRGGSDALVPGFRPMIEEVAAAWLSSGRLRLFVLEIGGKAAASWLLVGAGGSLDAWNTGFDDAFSRLSPAFQLMLHVIGDAAERGDASICLGGGGTEYKLRLADRVERLSRDLLVPRDARYPVARLRLAPNQARRALGDRLSPEAKGRLRRLARRR